jgi:hypothetical protein
MTRDTPVNDARIIWQSIQKEHSVMSLEEIRIRAQDAHSKVQRNLLAALGLGVLVLVLSSIAVLHIPYWSARITAGALMVLTAAAVYSAYRRMWRPHAPPAVAAAGCVAFYRTELEAQHRSLQVTWRLLAAAAVLSFFAGSGWLHATGINARIVIPAVLIAIIIERRYHAFQIKRKLTALSAFEREQG